MRTRSDLLARIEAFCRATGMTERHFGLRAVGSHHLVPRLRSGRSITLATIEAAEQFMAEGPLDRAPETATSPREAVS